MVSVQESPVTGICCMFETPVAMRGVGTVPHILVPVRTFLNLRPL